ncbi:SDR family oxidoreductase [Pseudonocardia nematodicida]|uniref:SDR family oxidoreductase n=1 Tax=Pseudonocardia nematodicida TaxID=1206997 RepID=A0ABV1KGI9_9PSEU
MTDRFTGRRIAVTGAAGGIGHALTVSLASRGATVYALDRTAESMSDLAAEQPARISTHACDVSSEESITAVVGDLYTGADAEAPAIDLVNCAGIVEDDVAAEDMPADQWDAVMGVNLRGAFLMSQAFGREMLARGGGAIVNVSSMSGTRIVNHPQRQCAYNTAKAGLSALTRSLAVEWGPRGVRVNAVSPGYVDTPLNARKQHMHAGWLEGTVLGRFAHLREITAAVEYLLDDDAGYCCGTDLLVDGGYSLR